MGLKINEVKQELKDLRAQKAELEVRIDALARYLDAPRAVAEGKVSSGVSARSIDLDLRPTVTAIFTENHNRPMKMSDIVEMVSNRHLDIEKSIVASKMVHVKRTMLEGAGQYGMYRMKLPGKEVATELPET